MEAHVLINKIQDRLGVKVKLWEVVAGPQSTVEFEWGPNIFFAVGGERITVMHVVATNTVMCTLHSKYMEGVLNGGVRDDSGMLIEPPPEIPVSSAT